MQPWINVPVAAMADAVAAVDVAEPACTPEEAEVPLRAQRYVQPPHEHMFRGDAAVTPSADIPNLVATLPGSDWALDTPVQLLFVALPSGKTCMPVRPAEWQQATDLLLAAPPTAAWQVQTRLLACCMLHDLFLALLHCIQDACNAVGHVMVWHHLTPEYAWWLLVQGAAAAAGLLPDSGLDPSERQLQGLLLHALQACPEPFASMWHSGLATGAGAAATAKVTPKLLSAVSRRVRALRPVDVDLNQAPLFAVELATADGDLAALPWPFGKRSRPADGEVVEVATASGGHAGSPPRKRQVASRHSPGPTPPAPMQTTMEDARPAAAAGAAATSPESKPAHCGGHHAGDHVDDEDDEEGEDGATEPDAATQSTCDSGDDDGAFSAWVTHAQAAAAASAAAAATAASAGEPVVARSRRVPRRFCRHIPAGTLVVCQLPRVHRVKPRDLTLLPLPLPQAEGAVGRRAPALPAGASRARLRWVREEEARLAMLLVPVDLTRLLENPESATLPVLPLRVAKVAARTGRKRSLAQAQPRRDGSSDNDGDSDSDGGRGSDDATGAALDAAIVDTPPAPGAHCLRALPELQLPVLLPWRCVNTLLTPTLPLPLAWRPDLMEVRVPTKAARHMHASDGLREGQKRYVDGVALQYAWCGD